MAKKQRVLSVPGTVQPGLQLYNIHRLVLGAIRQLGKHWKCDSTTLSDIKVVSREGESEVHITATIDIKLRKR